METNRDSSQMSHEKLQLELLNSIYYELKEFKNNIKKEYKSFDIADRDEQLYMDLKAYSITLEALTKTANSCRKSYHFGVEVFLDFIEKLLRNEIRWIKECSENYQISLLEIDKTELYDSFGDKLQAIPYSKVTLKSASLPLNETVESIYQKNLEALQNYVNIGNELKDDKIIKEIKEQLKELKNVETGISYYAAIIGPSLMGKTQTAFTLSHSMTVFYMNLAIGSRGNVGSVLQNIYRAFQPFSSILNHIVNEDIIESERAGGDLNASDFFDSKQEIIQFRILGLIFMMIKMKILRPDLSVFQWFKNIIDIDDALIPAMTIKEFKKLTTGKYKKFISYFY